MATNGINVDLAMPASLDKEHANGDLPHDGDIDDEHTRHHLAAETEDDMGVDDEDDDDTDVSSLNLIRCSPDHALAHSVVPQESESRKTRAQGA